MDPWMMKSSQSNFDLRSPSSYLARSYLIATVQEAWAKCFAVHLSKFEILQTKTKNQKHKNAKSFGKKLKTKSLMFFVSFFHIICKISNFNLWTAKHLAQASCTELTLHHCGFWELKMPYVIFENEGSIKLKIIFQK